jgi:hypothetical protein
VECESGTYAPTNGGTACLNCPKYTTSGRGESMACFCAPGTIVDYTERKCVPCPAGAACGQTITACAIGTYSPFEAATACLSCATARFEGATICPNNTCPEDFIQNATRCADGIVCACSQPNDFSDNVRCRSACAAGFFIAAPCTADADTICAPCTTACPSRAYWVSSACNDGINDLVCQECPIQGTFTDDMGACRACDPGSVFEFNGGCLRCPMDTPLSNANHSECVRRCPAGKPFFVIDTYKFCI